MHGDNSVSCNTELEMILILHVENSFLLTEGLDYWVFASAPIHVDFLESLAFSAIVAGGKALFKESAHEYHGHVLIVLHFARYVCRYVGLFATQLSGSCDASNDVFLHSLFDLFK